jgi:hypothetical protein
VAGHTKVLRIVIEITTIFSKVRYFTFGAAAPLGARLKESGKCRMRKIALLVSTAAAISFLSVPSRSQVSSPVLPLQPLGYCQLTTLDSATNFSACSGGVPAGANVAWISVGSQAIRYRDDGTSPTASVGFPIAAGGTLFYVGTPRLIQLIEQKASATVDVLFYHSP